LGKMWNIWECLLPGMIGLARIRAARRDWVGAHAILDDLLERTTPNTVMVRPAVEAQRAALQLMQGDLASAANWAAAFNTDLASANHLQWEQNALITAQIWLVQGKKLKAESFLARLIAEAESAGRLQVVHRIRQILQDTQLASSQQTKKAVLLDPLSERELEVLTLMAQGLSNPDIAHKLFLSPNTLKAHAQNIYSKLNVHNRMEAVNKARELNLL